MTWYYLCDNCRKKLWQIEDRLSKACIICKERSKMPEEFKICNACSYETGMCMGCGAPIKVGDDYDTMMEKALTSNIKGRKHKKKRGKG